MAGVRKVGWFLSREINGSDAFLHGTGAVVGAGSMSHESAPAVAPPPDSQQEQQPGPSPTITPAVLFITVVLAVVLLVSGMLHVLRQLFLKSHRANARAEAAERQLQQLFHLHEDGAGTGAGLEQAVIDALPVFPYGELSGAAADGGQKKRQFDYAVCLCEFADDDRLRLLPLCGHAFHVACIDTWLRSSSTCPLCRSAIPVRDLAAVEPDIEEQKQEQEESKETAVPSSVMLPVRLGRFKNVLGSTDDGEASTGSRLDARRCYSMGSYQYVLADDNLVVSIHRRPGDGTSASEQQGKKVCAAGRGDSFSVSKIWQWRGSRRRLPAGASSAEDDSLPWPPPPPPPRTRSTRQETDT